MKAGETTHTTTAAKTNSTQPAGAFFRKGGEGFFSTGYAEPSFFGAQAKLTVGQPGDKYEKEADAMADKVVQKMGEAGTAVTGSAVNEAPGAAQLANVQAKALIAASPAPVVAAKPVALQAKPSVVQAKCAHCEKEDKLQKEEDDHEEMKVQRKCAHCEEEEKRAVQKKETGGAGQMSGGPQPRSSLETSLAATKGSGDPLPQATRGNMESAFGADFSGVRIHNDAGAMQMSRDLGAQAFTHGSDIYFNAGKYDTGSRGGQHLLAHELTHTIQQGASSASVQRSPGNAPAPAGSGAAPAPGAVSAGGGGGAVPAGGSGAGLPAGAGGTANQALPGGGAGGAATTDSQARLPVNDNKGPSIGPAPVEANDHVVLLAENEPLTPEYEKHKGWEHESEVTLFKFPTEIGVMLGLAGKVKFGADFNVNIGPLFLRNVKVGLTTGQYAELLALQGLGALLTPLPIFGVKDFFKLMGKLSSKRFWGEATLDFQATVGAGIHFSAALEADAKLINLIKLAFVRAGVEASANARLRAAAVAKIQIEFKDGEMNFDKTFAFDSDFLLSLAMNAYLKAGILGWEFDLATIGFEKDLSKELLAFNLGTPFTVNSSSGRKKTEYDLPKTVKSVKKIIDAVKEVATKPLHGERKEGSGDLGAIQPPTGQFDPLLGVELANERAILGARKFQDFIGTNVAAAKYEIFEILPPKTPKGEPGSKQTGEVGYTAVPNTKGEIHSEPLLLAKVNSVRMAYKKGQYMFKIMQLLSEKTPCKNCVDSIRGVYPNVRTGFTDVFQLVNYVQQPKTTRPYLENLRNLLLRYGLTAPTVEAMQEELKPKKPAPETK